MSRSRKGRRRFVPNLHSNFTNDRDPVSPTTTRKAPGRFKEDALCGQPRRNAPSIGHGKGYYHLSGDGRTTFVSSCHASVTRCHLFARHITTHHLGFPLKCSLLVFDDHPPSSNSNCALIYTHSRTHTIAHAHTQGIVNQGTWIGAYTHSSYPRSLRAFWAHPNSASPHSVAFPFIVTVTPS